MTRPVGGWALFLVSLAAVSIWSSQTLITIPGLVNHTVVFSCGLPDHETKRGRVWLANDAKLVQIPDRHWINQNGSLSVRIQPEDMNIIYQCLSFSSDGRGYERYVYSISLPTKAFLAQTVKNLTVDWGTIYTFPCIFGGEAPRKDIMIFNEKVVNELHHNITEDSVVECRVENKLGFQHDKAFISVRHGTYPVGVEPRLTSETGKPTVFTIPKQINDTVLFSCGLPDLGPARRRTWMLKLKELTPVPGYRWINPNGSLTLRVRAEDSNDIYICTAFIPGSLDRETYVYSISLMVAASLRQSVENVTLDWGSVYTFPCSFSGTGPRKDTMIFNNRVVTETKHNVTEDSVVECRVQNALGLQHDKAFIKVRPGSKAWAQKFGPPKADYCQPYTVAMNSSSACLQFLDELAVKDPQPYLVARSRLSFAELTEQPLRQLFTAWDRLLVEKQSSLNAESDLSKESVLVDFHNQSVSFTAWRCVDWAKRLTCALTYPRCRSISSPSETANQLNKFFEERPVCRTHCLAVAGLFCMAPLHVQWNESALSSIEHPMNEAGGPSESGWTQLLSVPEALNQRLPIADLAKYLKNASSSLLHTCSSPLRASSVEFRQSCSRLPLEFAFSSPYTAYYRVPNNQSTPEHGFHEVDCLSGSGITYRGSATVPHCQPWAAFDTHVSQILSAGSLGNMWPGLSALNIHAFPVSLDTEASSSAVCRNPLGLASRPFCLGSIDVTSETQGNISQWSIFLCNDIAPCSVTGSNPNLISRVVVVKVNSSELSSIHTQSVVACVLVVVLACLVVAGYAVWRCNRCDSANSTSKRCLSSMKFSDTSTQKASSTMESKEDSLAEPGSICRMSDGTKELRSLERRRLILHRRRRLRQMHPFCQTMASCCYHVDDCLKCRISLESSDVGRVAAQSPWTTAKSRKSLLNSFRLCRIRRQRDKARSTQNDFPSSSLLSANESSLFNPIGYGRHVTSKPSVNAEDEEFEANTLSMKLQKPVAYVANAESDGRSKRLVGACLYNICATCGAALQTSSNKCLNCRKFMDREINGEHVGQGDVSQKTANLSTATSPFDASCVEAVDYNLDPGCALTQSSIQILDSASARLRADVLPEKLFNAASMMHLLHPKLKQICYPRSKLIEHRRLSKRAFGWIVLAEAPGLDRLVRRYRMLSLTAAERLGLTTSQEPGLSHGDTNFAAISARSADESLVVVKMLNDDADLETHANFLREAEVLVELSHKNIIELLGVCVPLRPPCLLLEYMPYGDLATLLRYYGVPDPCGPLLPLHFAGAPENIPRTANGQLASLTHNEDIISDETEFRYSDVRSWSPPKKLTRRHLLSMALNACDAMVYLSDRYYVHRDVATRSFLVGNQFILKLSDFSLCRPIKPHVDLIAKANECLPVKWLPPESTVNGIFHIDTDVWAFGVFLWELFSFASEPYGSLSYDQIIPFLETGKRLLRPADCPPPVYELMLQCWSSERSERPSFPDIRMYLYSSCCQ